MVAVVLREAFIQKSPFPPLLGALLSSPALDVRLMTALQVLQELGVRLPTALLPNQVLQVASARVHTDNSETTTRFLCLLAH